MFTNIFDFIISADHKASKKIVLIVITLISLSLLDYVFRFSDSYVAERKIEQLDRIQTILKDSTLSSNVRKELNRLQVKIINRKGLWDTLSYYFNIIQEEIKGDYNEPSELPKHDTDNTETRSLFWHVITSSSLFILMSVTLLLTILWLIVTNKLATSTLIGIILLEVLLVILIVSFSYTLALIPIIINPFVNYAFNIIINIIMYIILNNYSKKIEK